MLTGLTFTLFWHRISDWSSIPLIWLDWLARKPQECFWLRHPSAGITGMCCPMCFGCGCWKSKFLSSFLCGNQFTDWVFSPAPLIFLNHSMECPRSNLHHPRWIQMPFMTIIFQLLVSLGSLKAHLFPLKFWSFSFHVGSEIAVTGRIS